MTLTRVSAKDLAHDPSPQLSYKPIPTPTGPKPHIDLSTSKAQPITSIQTSPYPKPSRKIGPSSPPRSSPHQTKAHFENHSLPSNIHPNSSVKRKSTEKKKKHNLGKKRFYDFPWDCWNQKSIVLDIHFGRSSFLVGIWVTFECFSLWYKNKVFILILKLANNSQNGSLRYRKIGVFKMKAWEFKNSI